MTWRLVPFSRASGARNMGVDEAVMLSVGRGRSPPTVRLYGWSPDTVTIGRFQEIGDTVDLRACAGMGVDVVRRITGGGAVFHSSTGEVTYSLIAPEEELGKDIDATYREVCGRVVSALGRLGLEARFAPINDILIGERKVSGSAQTRRGGAVLQHGTVLYEVDRERMFRALRVGATKLSDKDIHSPGERVTSVREHARATLQELLEALEGELMRGRERIIADLSREELGLAREAGRRYASEGWNLMR